LSLAALPRAPLDDCRGRSRDRVSMARNRPRRRPPVVGGRRRSSSSIDNCRVRRLGRWWRSAGAAIGTGSTARGSVRTRSDVRGSARRAVGTRRPRGRSAPARGSVVSVSRPSRAGCDASGIDDHGIDRESGARDRGAASAGRAFSSSRSAALRDLRRLVRSFSPALERPSAGEVEMDDHERTRGQDPAAL
jgi:hypothetical protein